MTEIYDYLRLLWARVGTPHCPKCGKEIKQQTIDQIIDQVLALPEGTRIQVLAPVVRGKKGEHAKVLEDARKSRLCPRAGSTAICYELTEEIPLEKNKKHTIEIVVDRLVIRAGHHPPPDRLAWRRRPPWPAAWCSSIWWKRTRTCSFSQNYACEDCGISIEELAPRMFSFNSPFGACPTCTGLGSQMKVDPELIIPNTSPVHPGRGHHRLRLAATCKGDSIARMYFDALAKQYDFDLDHPRQGPAPPRPWT